LLWPDVLCYLWCWLFFYYYIYTYYTLYYILWYLLHDSIGFDWGAWNAFTLGRPFLPFIAVPTRKTTPAKMMLYKLVVLGDGGVGKVSIKWKKSIVCVVFALHISSLSVCFFVFHRQHWPFRYSCRGGRYLSLLPYM
jgi:hypothetical protein